MQNLAIQSLHIKLRLNSTNNRLLDLFFKLLGIMTSANVVYRSSSSLLFRRMTWRYSSSKLFVGGLSYDTNEPVLKDVFGHHGEILEVKVICDHKSGKSKGYGFVHFISEDSASKALAEMDGQLLDGRNIRIHYANNKKTK